MSSHKPNNNQTQIVLFLIFTTITSLSSLAFIPDINTLQQLTIFIISLLLASILTILTYSISKNRNNFILSNYPYPIFLATSANIFPQNNSASELIKHWQKIQNQDTPLDLKEKIHEALSSNFSKQYTEKINDQLLIFTIIPVDQNCIIITRDATEELQADQMKSEFVSLASHQLRTPLTAIKWLIERLQKQSTGTLNSKQQEITSKLKESSIRMINLVNDLLNISRIETGRMSINADKINLKTTIQELINNITPITEQHQQEIKYLIDPNSPDEIITDQILLKEVINNLLSNASKYSPDSTTIIVSLYKEGQTAKIMVRDNGYGIPVEEHIHIFDRFYRASNVVTKDIEGTGIGLYMCKLISKTLGGDIIFQSSSKGTVFEVSIPIEGLKSKQTDQTLIN